METNHFNPAQDAAHRAAEFPFPVAEEDFEAALAARGVEQRMAIKARMDAEGRIKANMPRYWLHDGRGPYGPRAFVLVGVRMPGDSEFPKSWMRHLCPDDDWQLSAAAGACSKLCLWGGHDKTEETGDGLWYGFEFSDTPAHRAGDSRSDWEQIKEMLESLLGAPGKWPGTR